MWHRIYTIVFLLAAVVALNSPAAANGGPVAWTNSTAHSGITPKQQNNVRLVREKLDIRLLEDFNRYTVIARYILANHQSALTIRYGVPINWSTNDTLPEVAKGIKLTLNGSKQKACQPVEFSTRIKPEEDDGYQLKYAAWCVVELTIPEGDNNELVLEYTGQLNYVDWETSKSALTNFDDRKLVYELWPAGYWNGPVDQLDLRIDLGPYAGLIKSHNIPEISPGQDKIIVKSLRNLDLNKFKVINVAFESEVALHPLQLATWNHSAPEHSRRKAAVKASSVLKAQGNTRYDPKYAVDGNPKTAWCAGKSINGIGEWIELRILAPASEKYACGLQGLALVPGYSRSDSLYLGNNRVRKFRVAHCETPNNYRDVTLLKPATHANRAAVMIDLDYDSRLPFERHQTDENTRIYRVVNPQKQKINEDWSAGSNCYRITILEIEPGTKFKDTCFSEIAPVFNCG